MTDRQIQDDRSNSGPVVISNTVSLIGFILALVAVALCAVLFWGVSRLPAETTAFEEQLESDTPAQLQLLILGCSTALLLAIALILCLVGLFLPNRPRTLAWLGTGISAVLLVGVFGVLLVGTLISPPAEVVNPNSFTPE